jgi:regulator of sigma D
MSSPKFTINDYTTRLIKVKEHNKLAIPKDSTIEGNYKMLNKIQQMVNIFDLKEVKTYFTTLKYSKKTILNYLSIILHMLVYETITKKNDGTYTKLLESFKQYSDEVNGDQEKMVESKKASTEQKQKSQDTSKEQVEGVIKTLNKLGMTKDSLILELLLDNPCRMEVGTLKYLKYENFMKITKTNEENYLVIRLEDEELPEVIISRASYKTSDKYGRVDFKLENQELAEKIITFIVLNKIHEGSPVFGYTAPQLAKRLHYLTKKYNDGTTLSTNAICKIHTTHEVKEISPTITEDMKKVEKTLGKISTKRGTSTAVLKKAYLKD